MCGIVGYSCSDPTQEHYDLLRCIITQSKIRGLHSFGLSYCNNGLKTDKYHDIDNLELPQANKIIYHNRYATSGDYLNHNNNQPIVATGVSLVFNGVLDMRTKQEMEAHYNIKMSTDNDGEILLQLYGSHISSIQEYIRNTSGSFAGLLLTDSNKMYAIRNKNRPLWRLTYDNATFYASTQDIFKRVDRSFEPQLLTPFEVYES